MMNGNKMKRYILVILTGILLLGCKTEPAYPDHSEPPLTSISAFVPIGDSEVEFKGIPDEEGHILIRIPYYYPEDSNNVVPQSALEKVRIRAWLVNNAVIENPAFFMDLTLDQTLTVIDQVKERHTYVLSALIARSDACDILSLTIPLGGGKEEEGVIVGDKITFATSADLSGKKAKITLSPHATVTPDPSRNALNFNQEQKLKVRADNGTEKVYTVNKVGPTKLDKGLREGSAKVLFEKRLYEDLGIDVFHVTGGIAVSGNHLVVNTRDRNSVVLDRLTGEKTGTLDLGDIKGPVRNFYTTADDEGVMLVCNLTANDGNEFCVWRIDDVNAAPKEYIRWDAGGRAFGRKLSIIGSLDGDAIITVPENRVWGEWNEPTVAKWTVRGGVLQSQTPELMAITGFGTGWDLNADAICISTEDDADYWVISYNQCILQWVDGKTHAVKASLDPLFTDYVPNALDYLEFNGTAFYTLNQACGWDWDDKGDCIWLIQLDSPSDFRGAPDAQTRPTPTGTETPGIQWFTKGKYGADSFTLAAGNPDPNHPVNGNCSGDVALAASEDGLYLYLYFMFTNGYVVGVQFDCLSL